jgi:hypothetical protein
MEAHRQKLVVPNSGGIMAGFGARDKQRLVKPAMAGIR